MLMKRARVFLTGIIYSISLSTLLISSALAQHDSAYIDSRGKRVNSPLGDLSFADEVVSFNKGIPSSAKKYCKSDQALGPPDYVNDNQEPPGYLTLGCGGTLIVRFVDTVLVDVDGPDLYVFEIGPDVEPTEISISKDGDNWITIEKASGGTAFTRIQSSILLGKLDARLKQPIRLHKISVE